MADSSQPQASPAAHPDPRFSELKSILLGAEQGHINRLQAQHDQLAADTQAELERLAQREQLTSERIAQQLPEAILRSSAQSPALSQALAPTIEQSIKVSIKQDPKGLVDAIFPILGPAIRKAIAHTLQEFVQSFNDIIEQSLTLRGLTWRLESLRTGRPFAEVALIHSTLYSVEQVFLIHKQTGLLLAHEMAPSAIAQDPDLVSSMLTAIQDFVRDSFTTQANDELDSLKMGALTIWVLPGPQAVLAMVVRGNPPASLRELAETVQEQLHSDYTPAFEQFQGDSLPFEATRPLLQRCLKRKLEPPLDKKDKPPIIGFAMLALLALLLIVWWGFHYEQSQRWQQAVAALSAQPGIVVVASELDDPPTLQGLRDPAAANPAAILSQYGFSPEQVSFDWEPYHSLDPLMILARLNTRLEPPASVQLTLLDNRVLRLNGEASHRWIIQARQRLNGLTDINGFDDGPLIDLTERRLVQARQEIDSKLFAFAPATATLSSAQQAAVAELADTIQQALTLAAELGAEAKLKVTGYADSSGSERINQQLSQQRARHVYDILLAHGIDPAVLIQEHSVATERRVELDLLVDPPHQGIE